MKYRKNIILNAKTRIPKSIAGELRMNVNESNTIGISGELSLQKKELQCSLAYRKRLLQNATAYFLVR